MLAKTLQKTQKSKNAQKYPKNEFFVCIRLSLEETRVRTRLALYNTRVRTRVAIYNIRVHLMYTTLCIGNPHVFLVYATLVSATRICLLKMSKNMSFEIRVVWVVMQLTPSIVTTLSSPLTLP